jgi:hypothetical protein
MGERSAWLMVNEFQEVICGSPNCVGVKGLEMTF